MNLQRVKLTVAGLLLVAMLPVRAITRQQLSQYAQSLNGLNKSELKTAAFKLMNTGKTVLSYGSGSQNTWWGFYATDRNAETNECINRYSNLKFTFGTRGKSISGMNIEHSFPKSWWGGSQNDAYKDLYNLYPCDRTANSKKSNYVMGVVDRTIAYDATAGEGYDLVGKGYADGKLVNMWEPGDQYKGDFCRSYMYMATAYQNFSWETEGLNQLQTGAYPTLRKWCSDLFVQWSRQDVVDPLEVARNNAVAEIQQNRNLFVDFPYLCEYIWGDSVDVPFNPALAISTSSDDVRYTGELIPDNPGNPTEPTEPEELEGDGTQEHPYNVASALKVLKKLAVDEQTSELYVTGIVTRIEEVSAQYGNATYYIADEEGGETLCIYRSKYYGNQPFTSADQLQVGQRVTIRGRFTNWKGRVLESVANASYLVEPVVNGIYGMDMPQEATEVYDLSGRRVTVIARPGIYVIGGRKVVVK